MKQISTQITEPRITIEFSLSEVQNLVKIVGAFSVNEIANRTVLVGNAPVSQTVHALYDELLKIEKNVTK